MKSLFYVIFLFVGLLGCQKEPFASSQTKLSLNFQCNEIEITKKLSSSQEREVKDINIYLFNKSTGNVTKEYITNTTNLSLTLIKGEYDVYVIANCGYNLGSKTKTEIENFRFSINNELNLEDGSVLLMTAKETVPVNGDTYLSIILKRLVARIDVNISTEFDFTFNSASIENAPSNCYGMMNNISTSGLNYDPYYSSSFSFYMFENLAGSNYAINSERQKNKDTAPSGATYIHIIGSSEGKKVEYSIYLGENNSTDFNVSRNNNYSYSINLKGINEVDSRVNIANLTVTPFADNCIVGEVATATVNLSCTENENSSYTMSYDLIEGNGAIFIDGKQQQNGVLTPFLSIGQKSKSVTLTYSQTEIAPIKIRVTARDNNGFTFSRDLTTQFIELPNKLEINNLLNNDSRGGGKSKISFEIAKKEYSGAVKLKYELLSGVGNVKYKGAYISANTEMNADIGDNLLEFIPTEVQDAKLKLTVTLDNGETISENISVKVFKMVIEARTEKMYTNKYGFVFYVDNVPATLHGETLPFNSCREIKISTSVSWICNSCSREVRNELYIENTNEYIKPDDKLISDGNWLNTNIHPTTMTIEYGCGNPGCTNNKRSGRLNWNNGSLEVYYPVTKFVTFLNMQTYPKK